MKNDVKIINANGEEKFVTKAVAENTSALTQNGWRVAPTTESIKKTVVVDDEPPKEGIKVSNLSDSAEKALEDITNDIPDLLVEQEVKPKSKSKNN